MQRYVIANSRREDFDATVDAFRKRFRDCDYPEDIFIEAARKQQYSRRAELLQREAEDIPRQRKIALVLPHHQVWRGLPFGALFSDLQTEINRIYRDVGNHHPPKLLKSAKMSNRPVRIEHRRCWRVGVFSNWTYLWNLLSSFQMLSMNLFIECSNVLYVLVCLLNF